MMKKMKIAALILSAVFLQGFSLPSSPSKTERMISFASEYIEIDKSYRVYPVSSFQKKDETLNKCFLSKRIAVYDSTKTSATISFILPSGIGVNVLKEYNNGWIEVEIMGKSGYISKSDILMVEIVGKGKVSVLTIGESFGYKKGEITHREVFYGEKELPVREEPNDSGRILKIIEPGTHILPESSFEDWIYANGGWIDTGDLKWGKAWVKGNTIIVNQEYGLSEDFSPGVNPEAKEQLHNLLKSLKSYGHNFYEFSNYRDYKRQSVLHGGEEREEIWEDVWSEPGHSEHQTGLAFDIGIKGVPNDENMDKHPSYVELLRNAYKFGFIVSYPKGKEDVTGYRHAPWHLRYVGERLAAILYASNQTIDEYFGTKYMKTEGR